MKKLILLSLFLLSYTTGYAQVTNVNGGQLKYTSVVELKQYKGQTFFSLMTDVIKPALDTYATEGFKIANGNTVIAALKKVDKKVALKAIKAAGSEYSLKKIADQLNADYDKITFYDLPTILAEHGVGSGRYDLTTFLALVSGGGVALKMNQQSFAYNVNYGTGEFEHDEKTGRSFGETTDRLALDASDKHYLQILENYVRTDSKNSFYFFKSILQILLNNDTSSFSKISPAGQAVASDFIAVYTAEQNRHLMAELKNHHWDEALLEVTLLAAFHGGQENVMIMFQNELTDTTLKQASGCTTNEANEKSASMIDYWQFSSSTDPANCNRSGINITRRDFRALGSYITRFQKENNPELVAKVERHFKSSKYQGNLFAQLSHFLINFETPNQLDPQTLQLAQDFTNFLMQVTQDADLISEYIIEDQN